MASLVELRAHAKVNLVLRVHRLRPGERLHRVDSVFVLYEPLYDSLFIQKIAGDRDRVSFQGAVVPSNNSVAAALAFYRKITGSSQRFAVKVVKRIPIGSGLGGGSSDAACVLRHLLGKEAGKKNFLQKAVQLGSDVPFFLSGHGTARVSGHGGIVRPCETDWSVAEVVFGERSSLTKDVFAQFDKSPIQSPFSPNLFLAGKCLPFNDLQNAFFALQTLAEKRLEGLPKDGGLWQVSGSGSSICRLVKHIR